MRDEEERLREGLVEARKEASEWRDAADRYADGMRGWEAEAERLRNGIKAILQEAWGEDPGGGYVIQVVEADALRALLDGKKP